MNIETHKSLLILGLGNCLLADEGVGCHVAQHLQKMDLPADVEVVDGGTGGFELIDHFHGKTKVVIIDCIDMNAPSGSIVRLSLEELELRQPHPFSAHDGGILELLTSINGLTPPPHVVVYGIVPAVLNRLDTNLSPTLRAQLPKIISVVLDDLTT